MSTSHDWARDLQRTADYLLSRLEVEMESKPAIYNFMYDKEKFLAAVRAMIPGRKVIDEFNVAFEPKGTILNLRVPRNLVCRKIQDVKYDCEPFLSPAEDAEMEAESEASNAAGAAAAQS